MRNYPLLTLVFSVLAWMLSIACGVDPRGQHTTQVRQALTQVPSQEAATALENFLSTAGINMATGQPQGGVVVKWHYSDALKRIWGDRIEFSRFGCTETGVVNNVYCLLENQSRLFGVEISADRLGVVKKKEYKDGSTLLVLQQRIAGFPVYSGSIRVRISDDNRAILSYFSSHIRGLNSVVQENVVRNTQPPTELPQSIKDVISNEIGSGWTLDSAPELVFLADQSAKSLEAVPAFTFIARTNNTVYKIAVDLNLTGIINIEDMSAYYSTKIYSKARFIDHATDTCQVSGNCTPLDYCYDDTYFGKHCVERCQSTTECENDIGQDWYCNLSNCDYYCNTCSDGVILSLGSSIYDSTQGGWIYSGYQYYHYFKHTADTLSDLEYFINNVLELGFNVAAYLAEPKTSGAYAGAHLIGSSIGFDIYRWNDILSNDWTSNKAGYSWRHVVFGHEASHNMLIGITESNLTASECLRETMVELMGSIFARYKKPSSNDTWQEVCKDVTITRSPFLDSPCGLQGIEDCLCDLPYVHRGFNSYGIPYSQRSRYDWTFCPGDDVPSSGGECASHSDCPLYQECLLNPYPPPSNLCHQPGINSYNNQEIWVRFARLLIEGSSTFTRDNHGENIGLTFSGVGVTTAADIVYEAWETAFASNPDSTTLEFVDALQSVGYSKGKLTDVEYSLGAAGFPMGPYMATGFYSDRYSDRAPRVIEWSDYQASSTKTFYVYKQKDYSNIIIRYHNGSSWTTQTIYGAYAADAPAVEVYNNRLHIFWRRSTDDAIMLRYYNTNLSYSQYSLKTNLNITADGPFDAVVFQGDLYLGFVRSGDDTISIARCTKSYGGCDNVTTSWENYGLLPPYFNQYYRDLDYQTDSGIGLASGSGINGKDSNEYLFAFLNKPVASQNPQLRVLCIDTDDEVDGYRDMDTILPSSSADDNLPRGITIMDSAFTNQPFEEGKYIYLMWNDHDSNEIYTSIMKDWSYGSTKGWFTRSISIFDSDESTTRGVSYWKRASNCSVYPIYVNNNDWQKYKKIYGRY